MMMIMGSRLDLILIFFSLVGPITISHYIPSASDDLFTSSAPGGSELPDSDLGGVDFVFSPADDPDFFSFNDPISGDDDFLDLADCSSSEEAFPSSIGVSKIRRDDRSCVASPGSTDPLKSQSLPPDLTGGLIRGLWSASEIAQRHSYECLTLTFGVLPWGVCYQLNNNMEALDQAGLTLIPPDTSGTPYPSFILDPCTLGKFWTEK